MTDYLNIGNDVIIHDTAIIKHFDKASIGSHVAIDVGVYISASIFIGDYVHIAPYVCIIGGINSIMHMEDFTNISAGSKIVCAGEDFTQGMLNPIVPLKYKNVINHPVIMKRFSAIGVNSVVLQGVEMAEGSVLGANSLLTKDTEPWTVYVGSPAHAIKIRDRELILKGYKELGYEYKL